MGWYSSSTFSYLVLEGMPKINTNIDFSVQRNTGLLFCPLMTDEAMWLEQSYCIMLCYGASSVER